MTLVLMHTDEALYPASVPLRPGSLDGARGEEERRQDYCPVLAGDEELSRHAASLFFFFHVFDSASPFCYESYVPCLGFALTCRSDV